VIALAERQFGVVSYAQLTGLGLGDKAIHHRMRQGHLRQIHRGVYAVGHSVLVPRGHYLAAVLRFGSPAVLSHLHGAALWDLRATSSSMIDVTTPDRGRHGAPDIRVHRVRNLHPDDRTTLDGIPVTPVHRLILDLAEVLTLDAVRRVYEEADRRGLIDLRAIEQMIARSPGRRGLRPLSTLIREQRPVRFTRSELERMLLDLCANRGIPLPQTNVWVEGCEVDGFWPQERLVCEMDSWELHGDRASFERDRVRDAALQLAGHRVLRFTHRRLVDEPQEVARTIETTLGIKRPSP